MMPVASPYLPNRERLDHYLNGVYERRWLSNHGPLVQELTVRLEAYLGVENLLLVSNGTLALQIAYRALGIAGREAISAEAITTPFSFVATASSLKWEGIRPVFTDIDSHGWCLDPRRIEAAITPHTRLIVPVHVFGNGCEVEWIDAIALRHDLRVVYDAAHAFGVSHCGRSILQSGDASILSFHATKLFHTIEGGAIVFRRKEDLERARQMIGFGIQRPDAVDTLGINAKMNEFQAAMGLCVLDEIGEILKRRSEVWNSYATELSEKYRLQKRNVECNNNFSYFPVLFESEHELMYMMDKLVARGIQVRRYFYPSLDSLDFLSDGKRMRISRDIASRIICLPMHTDVNAEAIETTLAVMA